MTVTLELRRRISYNTVEIDIEMVSKILNLTEETAGKQFVQLFSNLENSINDKKWLELIFNWSPTEGLSIITIAPWLGLASRVLELDTNYEGPFILSDAQAELIYKRLSNPEFKVNGINPALAGFLLDFYEAIGKHPEDMTDELMFDG